MINSDNGARLKGYTLELMAYGGDYELHLSVRPDTDLDGEFRAFDHAEQEMIRVYGWMFDIQPIDQA